MSDGNRKVNKGLLEELSTDVKVLSEKCQRDCEKNFWLNISYYVNEFNRIVNIGQKAQLTPCEGIEYITISKQVLDDRTIDQEKYKLGILYEVEAAASKLLARLSKQQDSIKGKTETTASGSTERPKGTIAQDWKAIEKEFGITKTSFGKKINFVSDKYKREVLFRDVEQAYALASSGFSKSAVILAGGVIEELLRLYLKYKNIKPKKDDFNAYILACEQTHLLKLGISRLSDSVRHFRNLVHLSKEKTKKHAISKSTAIGAVSSIFTIANDF